ncbi:MAG TPA: UbiA family prenyltransferase, partial [Bacteroidota bacterium]|nr:UbiA family prenyltransferase [Bacteroidota bacterium]
MRLQQWIKNLFLFAALVFSGHLFRTPDVALVCTGFFFFSFAASGIYIFNDIIDIRQDRLHPIKSKRPLPAGKLSVPIARSASVFLIFIGVVASFLLKRDFGITVTSYVVLNILYSLKLKEVVILDVMTIAAGFVLRVVAGALLIGVPTSEWLIICTILLSLF